MALSSRDVSSELRDFWKIFEHLAYRHQYVTVYDDYLTMCIFCFSDDNPEYKEKRDQALKKYNKKELDMFNALFFEMLRVYNDEIVLTGRPWYDFFGDLYMTISSTYKSSAMGQFFTPVDVIDMMIRMNDIKKNSNVSDPCCGSGRMLIAAHAHSKGCYVYGMDLDLMCCKMSALNMVIHGCNGEVVWMNSLLLDDYKDGWQIRPAKGIQLCTIAPLLKEQSFVWRKNNETVTELKKAI